MNRTKADDAILLHDGIDWSGCELAERVPGKVSGRPLVLGTRILADTIVQDADLGCSVGEIHENYPDLPAPLIEGLIAYARSVRGRRDA